MLAIDFMTEARGVTNINVNRSLHLTRELDAFEHMRRCVSMQQHSNARTSCKFTANSVLERG